MIYVCGDIHGYIDIGKLNIHNWPMRKHMSETDILIILGDFGLIWNTKQSKDEKYWLEWLLAKPCQIAFIDGNHENFDVIDKFPIIEIYGGKAQSVYTNKKGKSIYHLCRGEIFNIFDKKIFVMGGATSTDKIHRKEFLSWWKQEIPSWNEIENGFSNLQKHDYRVDFVLTHTVPTKIHDIIMKDFSFLNNDKCPCRELLQTIDDKIQFTQWHFGHYHLDNKNNPMVYNDKYFSHYNNFPFLLS